MSNNGPPRHFEVADPAAAFRRLEQATRHIMSVPKKKIDAMIAKERAKKKRR
jgi:hypothetical protein